VSIVFFADWAAGETCPMERRGIRQTLRSGIDHLVDLDRLEHRCRDILAKSDIPQSDWDALLRFREALSQTSWSD
jgi:hypothetical protein